jgi:hypothetical protein
MERRGEEEWQAQAQRDTGRRPQAAASISTTTLHPASLIRPAGRPAGYRCAVQVNVGGLL